MWGQERRRQRKVAGSIPASSAFCRPNSSPPGCVPLYRVGVARGNTCRVTDHRPSWTSSPRQLTHVHRSNASCLPPPPPGPRPGLPGWVGQLCGTLLLVLLPGGCHLRCPTWRAACLDPCCCTGSLPAKRQDVGSSPTTAAAAVFVIGTWTTCLVGGHVAWRLGCLWLVATLPMHAACGSRMQNAECGSHSLRCPVNHPGSPTAKPTFSANYMGLRGT